MRVLICGQRNFKNEAFLFQVMDYIVRCDGLQVDLVIEGGAPGADRIGRAWAISRGYDFLTFEADWDKYGDSAGPIRNREMLNDGKPDMVVAFYTNPDKSKGTKDMVKIARKAGIPVYETLKEWSSE